MRWKKGPSGALIYGLVPIFMFSTANGASTCSPSNSKDDNKNIVISSPSGTITSPGFPSAIPAVPLECIWKLQAGVGQVVRLELDSLDLFYSLICPVELHIKSGGDGSLFDVYFLRCGYGISGTVSSDGRNMWIQYIQKADVSKEEQPSGFSLRYSMVNVATSGNCSANSVSTVELQGQGSAFSSPKHPLTSLSNMTCRWNITAPQDMLVELRLSSSMNTPCNKDWVRVYDGATTGSPTIVKVCKILRQMYYSTGNHMLVEFVTEPGTSSTGFAASFTAVKVAPKSYSCNTRGNINPSGIMHGKIASQGFPQPYTNLAYCAWWIKVPFRHRVLLTFTSFSLQDGPKCHKDYVKVSGTDMDLYRRELHRFCGNKTTPFKVHSMDNEMTVYFRTDLTGRYAGFEAEYEAVLDPTFGNCTEQGKENIIPLTTPTGDFKTPRYPARYPADMICTWIIKADPGNYIRLSIRDFNLNVCEKSHVEVRDNNVKGKLIGRYCKSDAPSVIFSSGATLWVQFRSSKKNVFTRKGFTASYQLVPKLPLSISCSDKRQYIRLKGETGSIASYEYPLPYKNSIKCVYILSTDSSSKRIRLNFEYFDVEASEGCQADYVEVRDGGFPWSDVEGKFCGKTKPDTVTSSGGAMYITFHSNGNGTYGGFKASFDTTWTVKTIVLIAVFSVVGAIAVFALIGWMCKCWLVGASNLPRDAVGADVPLDEKKEDAENIENES